MNILLTSVGRRGYLVQYFKDALKDVGKVFVSNSDSHSPAFQYADEYVVSPLIYDVNYIDFVLSYCQQNDIKMVVSLFDIDLYVLAQNKEKFDQLGIILVVSDKEFIKVCNDKWLTYQYLTKHNILTPRTYLYLDEVLLAIKSKEVNYPVIVKPRWGMGSLEIFSADNEDELIIFYNKIKRDIQKSYLKYEAKQDLDHCVIIQEKIKGIEYGLDIINDLKGNYRNTIIRKKIGMRSGETDIAEIVKNDEILKVSQKLADISKHVGNLDVDVLSDGNQFYILELNARFGGGYPFSHLAGVDLPKALITWANGGEINDGLLRAEVGVIGHKDIQIVKL
ncbi:ATP-grasp domain-containing protein [[Clostridium] spiroforme]|nr:ATP-grasp domain-containing protein [Thomasclavelia spiroformis]